MVQRFWQVLGVVFALLAGAAHPAYAQGAFYEAAAGAVQGLPGTIIRQEAMSGAPLGASAYRVLYRSTGLKGEPIAVSGVVIVPANEPAAGGRPVVAWAHPTSGLVPRCAPSLAIMFFQQVQGLREMVERGYVVVATDYPGLGTPGPHPYLVGTSEGRAVLDSIRAARNLAPARAGARAALWGHSQGGQAVLYAARFAREYAPEIDIVGVAAAAPATELAPLMEDDITTSGGKNLLAMTIWSWGKVFDAPVDAVVEASAIAPMDRLANTCLESLIDILPRRTVGQELDKSFLKVRNLTALEPWKGLLAANTVGTLPAALPVFVAQGTADDTVDPPVTSNYVGKLCAAGSRVQAVAMQGVGHALAAREAAASAISWIADRFAGAPAPSDCPAR